MANKTIKSAKEEQQELEALHRLDEECVYQQQAGNYLKAFDCMERALVLRRHFFGAESPEVLYACKALAEMCNLLAMSFLQQDNYVVTIDLLKKAEILTKHHPSEKATTLNNLACYYRRLGKLHAAMTCLKRALEIEKKLQSVRNAADTHLNLCAVLSQLGKHQQALEQAQEALIILQEEFFQSRQPVVEKAPGSSKKDATSLNHETEGGKAVSSAGQQLDRVSVMCIAYHNIGVEQEFLKDYANSVVSYKKGVGLAEQYLGVDHAITATVRNSYLAAKRTISTKSVANKHGQQSGGADSPLSKSPGKASTRLLNSPRSNGSNLTNSLRLPSPLSKEKQRHNIGEIPTPRSIVADVLAKGATLPPLDAKSPFKGVLSPRDPFFSPRFRFDGGCDKDGDARSVAKTPGSVKKKRKEVKFQPPVAAEEDEEPPISENNNSLSGPAVEVMMTEMEPVSQAEPLVEERSTFNLDAPVSPQALRDDFQQAPLVGNARDALETSEDLTQDSASTFQHEEQHVSPPPVNAEHVVEANAGDIIDSELINVAEISDESLPPEAEPTPTEENELESESPSRQGSHLSEAEVEKANESPAQEALGDFSTTAIPDTMLEAADATGASIESAGGTDPLGEAVLLGHQTESQPETEDVPASDEVKSLHEIPIAAAESLSVSCPDDPGSADAGAIAAVVETEELDKKDILSLLDESTGDPPVLETRGDSSVSSELSATPTESNIAVSALEARSASEASGVEPSDVYTSTEAVEASGSPRALVPVLENSILKDEDEDEETAAIEDSPLVLDRSVPTSEPIAQMADEDADINEVQDHAESSANEVTGSDLRLDHEGEAHSLPEVLIEPTWATEDVDSHSSETHDGFTPMANEELHSGYEAELEQPEYSHPDEQPVLQTEDSSGYMDTYGHEEFAPEGGFYSHEAVETPEYESHHQVDTEPTENNSVEVHYERHLTPDPGYDDQLEHETTEAVYEDHPYAYHDDPGQQISSEYPPDDSAFYTEDGSQVTFGDTDTALEGYSYAEQPLVESELALEH